MALLGLLHQVDCSPGNSCSHLGTLPLLFSDHHQFTDKEITQKLGMEIIKNNKD